MLCPNLWTNYYSVGLDKIHVYLKHSNSKQGLVFLENLKFLDLIKCVPVQFPPLGSATCIVLPRQKIWQYWSVLGHFNEKCLVSAMGTWQQATPLCAFLQFR